MRRVAFLFYVNREQIILCLYTVPFTVTHPVTLGKLLYGQKRMRVKQVHDVLVLEWFWPLGPSPSPPPLSLLWSILWKGPFNHTRRTTALELCLEAVWNTSHYIVPCILHIIRMHMIAIILRFIKSWHGPFDLW